MGISFTSDMVGSVLDYVNLIWIDIKLPVLMLIGVMVGFFILTGIMNAIIGGKEKIDEE